MRATLQRPDDDRRDGITDGANDVGEVPFDGDYDDDDDEDRIVRAAEANPVRYRVLIRSIRCPYLTDRCDVGYYRHPAYPDDGVQVADLHLRWNRCRSL